MFNVNELAAAELIALIDQAKLELNKRKVTARNNAFLKLAEAIRECKRVEADIDFSACGPCISLEDIEDITNNDTAEVIEFY